MSVLKKDNFDYLSDELFEGKASGLNSLPGSLIILIYYR